MQRIFIEEEGRAKGDQCHQKVKNRMIQLAPYIAEIQRRKKLRLLAKQSKKTLNESSSRSFRIKDASINSLQKQGGFLKTRETTMSSIVSKLAENRAQRQQRAKSLQKHREIQYSKTVQNRPRQTTSHVSNHFFNDLYVRVRNKVQKERVLPKRQYQTIQAARAKSEQTGHINTHKIGSTEAQVDIGREERKDCSKNKKGNFRRNKFQVQSQPTLKVEHFTAHSSSVNLDKKDSNLSLNQEMDRLALRQMQQFYSKVRTREIQRSVDSCTEKYFQNQCYRPLKSKNDIQVLLTNAKTPPLQAASHSTTENIEKTIQEDSLNYDFSFPQEDLSGINLKIMEVSNLLQEDEMLLGEIGVSLKGGPKKVVDKC